MIPWWVTVVAFILAFNGGVAVGAFWAGRQRDPDRDD
jgi:hypothetical protein